jgi:hypothetical protein
MDSDLEAFSRNPTDGSFAVLAFQLATFTKYLNEVFLRTNFDYCRSIKFISRVKLTCLTTV